MSRDAIYHPEFMEDLRFWVKTGAADFMRLIEDRSRTVTGFGP